MVRSIMRVFATIMITNRRAAAPSARGSWKQDERVGAWMGKSGIVKTNRNGTHREPTHKAGEAQQMDCRAGLFGATSGRSPARVSGNGIRLHRIRLRRPAQAAAAERASCGFRAVDEVACQSAGFRGARMSRAMVNASRHRGLPGRVVSDFRNEIHGDASLSTV